MIFSNVFTWIINIFLLVSFIQISLHFVPWDSIRNKAVLAQVMAWCQPGLNHYLNHRWHSLLIYIYMHCSALMIHVYPSGLLHWHWGNHAIAPVPVKQPWRLWVNRNPLRTDTPQYDLSVWHVLSILAHVLWVLSVVTDWCKHVVTVCSVSYDAKSDSSPPTHVAWQKQYKAFIIMRLKFVISERGVNIVIDIGMYIYIIHISYFIYEWIHWGMNILQATFSHMLLRKQIWLYLFKFHVSLSCSLWSVQKCVIKKLYCCCLHTNHNPETLTTYLRIILNTLSLRQNGYQFPDDNFKCTFSNENIWISQLKFHLNMFPRVRLTIRQHWFR